MLAHSWTMFHPPASLLYFQQQVSAFMLKSFGCYLELFFVVQQGLTFLTRGKLLVEFCVCSAKKDINQ